MFLLAWGMSFLIMAQPWTDSNYHWRFALMLATPVVLFAAIGLVEGIGPQLWNAGRKLESWFSESHFGSRKVITMIGRVGFICLLFFVVAQQALTCHTYAFEEGGMHQLEPTINMDQYNALVDFQQEYGQVYVFITPPNLKFLLSKKLDL